MCLGFGIFLANTRFDFEVLHDGPKQGWRMGHSGYLPEADLIFALALFIRAKKLDAGEACGYLKPHLAKMLRGALRGFDDDDPGIMSIRHALASAENSSGGAPAKPRQVRRRLIRYGAKIGRVADAPSAAYRHTIFVAERFSFIAMAASRSHLLATGQVKR